MESNGSANYWLTPFEATTLMQRESKRPNGTGVTGIVLGSAALLAAAGAWIFGGCFASSKSKANTELIRMNNEHQNEMFRLLGNSIVNERNERSRQMPTLQSYIDVQTNPTQSGTAASSALADAMAYAQAINNSNNTLSDAIQQSSYLRVQPISVKDCGCGCGGN